VGVLVPGETLLASVRATPVGPFGGSMGIFAGAVVGAVVQSIAVSRSVKQASLSRFPLAGRMVIAITDRRLLVWQLGGLLGGSITRFLGPVPLGRIGRVELDSVPGRSMLTFVMRDAPPVGVETDKRDTPQGFVQAFHRSSAGGAAPSAEHPMSPGPGAAPHGEPAPGRPSAPAGSWTLPPAPTLRPPGLPPGLPAPPGVPAPPLQRSAAWPVAAKVAVAAFVAIVSAVATYLALARGHHSRISIPDSIAGAQRIVTPASHQAEEQILDGARRYGVKGKVGFYGVGGLPSFAVVAYDYQVGPADTPESIMQGLAAGVTGAETGSSVDLSTATTDSVEGVTYRCVRVLGQASGAICMWEETDVVGLVLALNQEIPQARLLTGTVRLAVEA
jgi:hypothetical protein